MNVRKKFAALAMIGLMSVSALCCQPAYAAERPSYLKSVTYFGDEWPINYWGSEDKDMAANFEKIKADGFNSIILVIPWREFQPADGTQEFNPVAFERLNQVMTCAAEHDLWVVLRIGYSWDYYGASELPARFGGLVNEGSADRALWLQYCQAIYQAASAHPNFHSGFITWEDFWDYVHNMGRNYDLAKMRELAATSGYQQYLSERYSLEYVSAKYGTSFGSFAEVYLPKRSMEAAELFFEFYDDMLNGLLAQSQTVFPGLSMEVRADGDPVYRQDGSMYYYSHHVTYPCNGAEYSALMYSVSMGQKNESDRISAGEALAATDRNLDALGALSGKKYYAEQLLYMDTTEEFSYNTQVHDEEVDDYVCGLAPILQKNTMGYGLWVYRNYVNNCVYNGQFGLDTTGWRFSGNCNVEEVDGTMMACLAKGSSITQNLTGRMSGGKVQVEFYAKPEFSNSVVTVTIGSKTQEIKVPKAGTYTCQFTYPWNEEFTITIGSNKRAYVDDVRVYTYEQYGRIYDKEGNEQDLADDFRFLNSQLP